MTDNSTKFSEILKDILKRVEKANELHELMEQHSNINIKLEYKAGLASIKDQNGEEIPENVQKEIDNLAKRQEKLSNQIINKAREIIEK